MELPFDKYTYRARLLPSLLGVIFVSSGFATLLSHIGRDLGKRKEVELFRAWGGVPTTLLLSHRLTKFDTVTLARYHAKLGSLIPNLHIPGLAEERASPSHAAEIYGSCIAFLKEKTRDQKVFALLLAENINFGFRRNLLGWKPVGLIAAMLGLVSCTMFTILQIHGDKSILLFGFAGTAVSASMLLLWRFVIRPEWVRLAADTYAERLVRSLDVL
jgi:hypothetical protein